MFNTDHNHRWGRDRVLSGAVQTGSSSVKFEALRCEGGSIPLIPDTRDRWPQCMPIPQRNRSSDLPTWSDDNAENFPGTLKLYDRTRPALQCAPTPAFGPPVHTYEELWSAVRLNNIPE
jgi:hypothetical protein